MTYSYNRGYADGKANRPFVPTAAYLDGYNAGQDASDRNAKRRVQFSY